MWPFNTTHKKKYHKKTKDAEIIANIVSEQLSTETTRIIEELKQYRELDYDKLADAIVKAQKKYTESDSTVSKMMSTLIGLAFYIISIIAGLLSLAVLVDGWYLALTGQVVDGKANIILFLVLLTLLCATIIILAIALFKSAQELEKERDKQFIVAVFSAMMSFSAVVIALISVLK